MATRRRSVPVLTLAFAVIAALSALALVSQGARATLVSVNTCDGGSIALDAGEKRMLELHNRARTRRGLKPLCVHPALTEAARAHTQEMLGRDFMSHESFDGETVGERLERFGYTSDGYSYYWYGENIAWGCGSSGAPDVVFKWWMNSPDHRSNILGKRFREVGIGAETGTYKTCAQATVYTVDFGGRRR